MMNLSGSSKPILPRNNSKAEALPPIRAKKRPPIRTPKAKLSKKKTTLVKKDVLKPLSITQQAEAALAAAPEDNGTSGEVRLRFNHYNNTFRVHNGVLKWSDVDEEYCFSFVYRGNYIRRLAAAEVNANGVTIEPKLASDGQKMYALLDETLQYFVGLRHGEQYIVEVQEDTLAGIGAEGLRLSSQPLHAHQAQSPVQSGNRAVSLLTSELKGLRASDLQGREARELIERRDIEDILYSNA